MKKNFETKELAECSFKPKIIEYKLKETTQQPIKDKDHCISLYKLAKKKKSDKTTIDYEFEKAGNQCTFSPNIQKEEVDHTPVSVDKAMVDRAIERMKKGREERERINNAVFNKKYDSGQSSKKVSVETSPKLSTQKGKRQFTNSPVASKRTIGQYNKEKPETQKKEVERLPDALLESQVESSGPFSESQAVEESDVKTTEEQKVTEEQENQGDDSVKDLEGEPLLFIDVNLGNVQKRIVVYKGDQPKILAENFARENSNKRL